MYPCLPCLAKRGLITDISRQIKGMSIKTARMRRKKPPPTPASTGGEAIVGGEEVSTEVCGENEKEWVAEPEPGVLLTLETLPNGENKIKRIKFRQDLFDSWGAKKWWSEHYDNIMELYTINAPGQASPSPPDQTEDGEQAREGEEESLPVAHDPTSSISSSSNACQDQYNSTSETLEEISEAAAHAEGADGGDEVVGCDMVEEEPGVFLTLRATSDGSLELLRVELSRERFGEVKARVWWEENKARLNEQYKLAV